MLIVCTCGHQSENIEAFSEHRHDAHDDGSPKARCCNCGKLRRKADMLHWPGGVHECVHCDGEIYLKRHHDVRALAAITARTYLPVRQPEPPTPTVAPRRFAEAWEG